MRLNRELLGWADFYVGCSGGGSVGGGWSTVFYPLSLCLEVYLLSTVWFDTHPLLLQIFVGYEPCFLVVHVILFFSRLLGDF